MRINIRQNCDEAMGDSMVIDFVTDVYLAASGREKVFCIADQSEYTDAYVDLYVGHYIGACKAVLCTPQKVLGEWDKRKKGFYASPRSSPFLLHR